MPRPRIASLLSSSTEMLCELRLADALVAVSHECDWPPAIRNLPRATSTRIDDKSSSGDIDRQVQEMLAAGLPLYDINVELLCELKPDLIVTQAQCDVCAVRYEDVLQAVQTHSALRAAHVHALNPHSLRDVLDDIRRLSEITGTVEQGQQVVAQLESRIERVRTRTSEIPPAQRPRVAAIEWLEPPMLAGNWMPEMIQMAGGQPLDLVKPGEHSPYITWEDVSAAQPDVILLLPCGFDLKRTLQEATALPNLPVKTGRVHALDGNAFFNRAGPRMVTSLEILAHLLHPETFAAPQVEVPAWQQFS